MKTNLLVLIAGSIRQKLIALNTKIQYKHGIKDLQKRGLKKGKNVLISPGVRFDKNYPYLISIGNNCVIGKGVHVITHDTTLFWNVGGYLRLGKVDIKDNCIIGINTTILPGVTIGPNVLIAPNSLINKDVPPNSCVAGVPARFYSKFDKVVEKYKEEIKSSVIFDAVDLTKKEDEKEKDRKRQIIEAAENGPVYLKGMESKYPVWLEIKDDSNL